MRASASWGGEAVPLTAEPVTPAASPTEGT